MRLLKVHEDGQLTLTKKITSNIPPYAILSHTWGPEDDEVTFDDITKDTATHKRGYKKIQFCANQAASDGLTYFWVDTCCIDKSNNTELTTAINSMFKWYQNAAKCYVFLSDVSFGNAQNSDLHTWKSEFRNSKWFTGGWTLQELIAPSLVEFYSLEGKPLGDKLTLRQLIHQITGIPTGALSGSPLSGFSRSERMLWAMGRVTKLEEDKAYSLIGIFEISLPLVYGEGAKRARRRLEEEIDKQEAFERRDRLPDHPSCSVASLSFKATQRKEPCLQSLLFPEMNTRYLSIEPPADDTCLWLFAHPVYQGWCLGRGKSLLFLKGKPGAGKSTLMKEAFRRASLEQHESETKVAAFFFNRKGSHLEQSLLGLYRSLLYQLLPGEMDLRYFSKLWDEKCSGDYRNEQNSSIWNRWELESFFKSLFSHRRRTRTMIFIDALDESNEWNIQRIVSFWLTLTRRASLEGAKLSVCISIRDFPEIAASGAEKISVQNNNSRDITTYVEQHLMCSIAAEEPQRGLLKDKILHKSSGVFLWVVLVVDDFLRKWNDGGSIQYLLKHLDTVPDELQDLFSHILIPIHPSQRDLTLRLFYWAILAVKPLRLYEWHHILAFIRTPSPSSLQEWRESDHFTENDDQLEKKIKSLSRALLEIGTSNDEVQDESLETISACAGAGSLSLGSGETRVVQVIHESVREFFLEGDGFSTMGQGSTEFIQVEQGHISIMATCLDYINIRELDTLIQARNRATEHHDEDTDAGESLEEQDSNRARLVEGYSKIQAQLFSHSSAKRKHYEFAQDKRDGQRKAPFSLSKSLRTVSPLEYTDLSQWLETLPASNGSDNENLVNKLKLNSSPTPSVTNRSEVLEDHPALLSYALYELPTHARLAESMYQKPIVDRLKQDGGLERWITLREDSTIVRHHLAGQQDLSQINPRKLWFRICDLRDFLEQQDSSFIPEGKKPKTPALKRKARKRKDRSRSSSVASFSSASSHTGSLA